MVDVCPTCVLIWCDGGELETLRQTAPAREETESAVERLKRTEREARQKASQRHRVGPAATPWSVPPVGWDSGVWLADLLVDVAAAVAEKVKD